MALIVKTSVRDGFKHFQKIIAMVSGALAGLKLTRLKIV
jgi:hypothetical protein